MSKYQEPIDDPEALGARMNVRLPPAKTEEILPLLDRWAKLIRQLGA